MAYVGKARSFLQRRSDGTDGLIPSPVKLDLMREDISTFVSPSKLRPVDELFDRAVKLAYETFSLPAPVNPIHLNDFPRAEWDKWHTSPGLPWKDLGFEDKLSVAQDKQTYRTVRWYCHIIKDGDRQPPYDCDAYVDSRTVENEEQKVRTIWGYPATIAFQEACFALPLIKAYKQHSTLMAYDIENVNDECKNIFLRFEKGKFFLSSNYKSFDKTIPAWLIRIAFDILLKNVDMSKYADRGIPDPAKLLNAWKYVVYYFINTPIRLRNGERYRKHKGIPNGSSFKELVSCIVNYVVTMYGLLKSGNEVRDILVFRNNSLVSTSLPVDIAAFSASISCCGMSIDTAKTQVGDDINRIKFLNYFINVGEPTKDSNESSVSLCYPEDTNWSYNDFASCQHGSYITNFTADPNYDNYYGHFTNEDFIVQHVPCVYQYPCFVEIDFLPQYPLSVFTPWNIQY